MIALTATVVGAEKVTARFETAPDRVRVALRGTVQELGLELLAKVKAEYLTGQSLKVQTGRLRRSINEKTTVSGDEVSSSVGTNVAYGRFWELGFDGTESVQAHMRRTTRAEVMVRGHQRRVHQPARAFLQPALAEMRPIVRERVAAAVKGAI